MSASDEIVDPQLGKIQLPRPPKRKDAEPLIKEQADAFDAERIWEDDSVTTCPSCGRLSLVGRSDLSYGIGPPGGVIVFRHVQGAKCTNCQAQCLEPGEQIRIEREAKVGPAAD